MAALPPFSIAKMYFISKRIWCKKRLKNIYNLLANYLMQQILINQLQLSLKMPRAKILPIRARSSICLGRSRITVIYEKQFELNSIPKGKITLKIVNKLFYCIKILKSQLYIAHRSFCAKFSCRITLNPPKIISPRIFDVQIYVWSLFKAQEVYFSENERFMVHGSSLPNYLS